VSLLRFWHERVERFRWQSSEVEWSAQRIGVPRFGRNGPYLPPDTPHLLTRQFVKCLDITERRRSHDFHR
jgi:hypothetical protein